MSNIDKQSLRQLAVDAKELAIIKRYTKGIEAQKKFIAVMTPATVLALLDELEAKDTRIAELEAPAPELKMAHLINKFYERYPLAEFKSDTERSAALGYFMAGAELQCFGEFINYAELMGDE